MVRKIQANYEIETIDGEQMLINIERAGRTCYKSDSEYTLETAKDFASMILKRGHESVIEHEKVTVRVICDRGVTHEIVRHRLASYSQESTRYCNYSKNKHGNEITVIDLDSYLETAAQQKVFNSIVELCESAYMDLLEMGVTPQIARGVLPNILKTEIVMTMNLREWRHFFKLRTSIAAHPQMREIACPMLEDFKEMIPIIFDDIPSQA